jgi:hypothetical protein
MKTLANRTDRAKKYIQLIVVLWLDSAIRHSSSSPSSFWQLSSWQVALWPVQVPALVLVLLQERSRS